MATSKPMQQRTNAQALKHASFNLWQIIAVASISLHFLILGDNWIADLFEGEPSAQRALTLDQLEYQDGIVLQRVSPINSDDPIQANWVASIWQITDGNSVFICGGPGGLGTYKPRAIPAAMTVDQWAGDECHLTPGQTYIGRASWEWLDVNGRAKTLNGRFEFVAETETLKGN